MPPSPCEDSFVTRSAVALRMAPKKATAGKQPVNPQAVKRYVCAVMLTVPAVATRRFSICSNRDGQLCWEAARGGACFVSWEPVCESVCLFVVVAVPDPRPRCRRLGARFEAALARSTGMERVRAMHCHTLAESPYRCYSGVACVPVLFLSPWRL